MDTVHSAISEPVRRLEVFTGVGRRRKWSKEDKPRCCPKMPARKVPRVNADLIFPRSAEVKFPSLAGWGSAVGEIDASVFRRLSPPAQGRQYGRGLDVGLCPDVLGHKV